MTVALYEFPLCEKVRNYLRLEQLFLQLDGAASAESEYQYLYFFEVLFDLIDLIERLDLRSDFVRDFDLQEKNLVHWSQHPDIDSTALEQVLTTLRALNAEIKSNKKMGAGVREEKLLNNIRQRFAIPGGATSFDLPNLFCWLKQPIDVKNANVKVWRAHLSLVENAVQMLMSFLRERGRFTPAMATNAFYQGNVEDKTELIRVKCDNTQGFYPVLSGNKYRYGIKFMALDQQDGSSEAITDDIPFEIASC
ncbi:cell division protein ZapD [Glaciecola sp. XM2]|jgi:cell division protein ZapD|uniref:cell division protein ZapD n=1 Tax=Glaciecola sp. XM2 TaxID=1914931 RepID=UPI001BDF26D2|nr:cell division protein ZapD [Glaciecola sp. XM2]MBT1450525.1 cell division protein ZapD [Glaciecola sp. XM2]